VPAEAQEPTWVVSPISGNSYTLSPPGTWEASQQWAASKGANLVTIRSAAEQEWLRATFAQTQPAGLWLGLNDFQTSREWRWVSGESVTYTNWHPGEPNSPSERAGMMFQGGGWNDGLRDSIRAGIAERTNTVPEGFTVWNVNASQRKGTKIVDITYNIRHPLGFNSYVVVEISQDGGATYSKVPAITGAFGGGITSGFAKAIEWRAGTDWTPALFSNVRVRISADDGQEMTLIPGGAFEMGYGARTPVLTTVDSFYIGRTEVTNTEWETVRAWAVTRGYTDLADLNIGRSGGVGHPSVGLSWWHAIQWLNAKSEMEGLTPAYFATVDRLELYRRGAVQLTNNHVNWSANGYRLPTEAEWEWAARGGLTNKLYPWGDTITPSDANYTGGSKGVVSYRPNGYGLFDMAGNVWEWIWDTWQDAPAGGTNPRGPDGWGSHHYRGGGFREVDRHASVFMVSGVRHPNDPGVAYDSVGFRYVRNATP
jgi:formylglycine-generating enzyme required for sulfatase activity